VSLRQTSLRRAVFVSLLLTALASQAAQAAQLQLSWTANSTDEDGFSVERKTGTTGTFAEIARTGPVTIYTDSGLPDGTTYCYQLRAFNTAGYSGYSNQACGTTGQTLTVVPAGTGSGTVTSSPAGISCGPTCAASFPGGSAVTLTAASATGSVFAGWSGGGCSGTGACAVTLTAATAVTATFTSLPSQTVTLTPQDTFLNLDTINYSASTTLATYTWPNNQVANAILMKFDLSSVPSGVTVYRAVLGLSLVESDTSPDATYTVTVHKIVGRNPDLTRATGYTYDGTNGWTPTSCCYTNIPLAQADISAPYDTQSIDKTLGYKSWTVTALVQEWLASPSSNFGLLLNSDGSKLADRYRSFASAENPTASIRPYLSITYSLPTGVTLTVTRAGSGSGTVTSSPAGISCGATCNASYASGTAVTLTATAASGSVFAGWSGGGCSGTGPCAVTLTATTTVTATFNPAPPPSVSLTVAKAGTGSGTVTSSPAGISCGATCSASYVSGTAVTLTATPASGSVFAGWSGGGCSGTGPCAVTLTAATTVTATFTVPTVMLTVSRGGTGNGTVTSSPAGINCGAICAAAYANGTLVALTATPAKNSLFAGWSGACSGATSCVVTMTAARSVTATFAKQTHRKANIAVYRDTTELWQIQLASGSVSTVTWGSYGPDDIPVPADYDGDGLADLAIYEKSTGRWEILNSASGTPTTMTVVAPVPGDLPIPADYDGDGRADPAIYRTATGEFFVLRSSDGVLAQLCCAAPPLGDVPIPADYDGDGRADVAVYRGATGEFFILRSSDGVLTRLCCAAPKLDDVPIAADYDGDGRADVAVYRGATGEFFILRSSDGVLTRLCCAAPKLGDVPIPVDYDGDGRADVGVYRQTTGDWFILRSSNGTLSRSNLGTPMPGDIPVPASYE
jgi:hypothetical protein